MLGWKRRTADKITSPSGNLIPIVGSSSTGYEGTEDVSDTTIYRNQATRYTWSDLVYTAVNRIAEMGALQATKLRLYDPRSERDPVTGLPSKEVPSHPYLELWSMPNPWDSPFEFLESTLITLQINGNAFWHVDDGEGPQGSGQVQNVRLEGEPAALWLLRPDRMHVKPSKDEYIEGYLYEVGGHKILFDADAVVHLKRYHPLKDYEGLSPVEPANYASLSDISAQRSNWALFRNGLKLSGVAETDRDNITPEQLDAMEEYIQEVYSGDPERGHQVLFLWNSFKYNDLGMNMRDAEFVEGSKLNRLRILGVFGVHPAVMLSEDVNRANAQVGEYLTLKYTVAPLLERVASDITRMVNLVWEEQEVEVHFTNVVPQDDDLEARIAVQQAEAVQSLIRALGPDEGVAEAQRKNLLSDDVDSLAVPLRGAPGIPFGVTDFGDDEDNGDEDVDDQG